MVFHWDGGGGKLNGALMSRLAVGAQSVAVFFTASPKTLRVASIKDRTDKKTHFTETNKTWNGETWLAKGLSVQPPLSSPQMTTRVCKESRICAIHPFVALAIVCLAVNETGLDYNLATTTECLHVLIKHVHIVDFALQKGLERKVFHASNDQQVRHRQHQHPYKGIAMFPKWPDDDNDIGQEQEWTKDEPDESQRATKIIDLRGYEIRHHTTHPLHKLKDEVCSFSWHGFCVSVSVSRPMHSIRQHDGDRLERIVPGGLNPANVARIIDTVGRHPQTRNAHGVLPAFRTDGHHPYESQRGIKPTATDAFDSAVISVLHFLWYEK